MFLYRFEDVLKDGVVLCHLMNKIQPNSIKRIAERGTNFQLMENIQRYFDTYYISDEMKFPFLRFQSAARKYGVPDEEIFQTADLFERRNINQVMLCLFSLGRIVSDQQWPPGRPDFIFRLYYRPNFIRITRVQPLVPRWPLKTNVISVKTKYVV